MSLPSFLSILLPIALLTACEAKENQSPFSEQSIKADFLREAKHGNLVEDEVPEIVYENKTDYIFKIKYYTEGQDNVLQIATALVIVPKKATPTGGSPVLLWNHGTIGLPDDCSPSAHFLASYNDVAKFPTQSIKSRNYITIIPDYDGYHTKDEVHHYATHEVNARSSLDAVQSLLNMYGSLINREKIAIAGYSLGGGVTLRALQIQEQRNGPQKLDTFISAFFRGLCSH